MSYTISLYIVATKAAWLTTLQLKQLNCFYSVENLLSETQSGPYCLRTGQYRIAWEHRLKNNTWSYNYTCPQSLVAATQWMRCHRVGGCSIAAVPPSRGGFRYSVITRATESSGSMAPRPQPFQQSNGF